jgi:hypothetical protein
VTRVRAAIAVGLALIGVALLVTLLHREEPFVGDNGREIELPAFVVIPAGEQACQPEGAIPDGAGTARITVSTDYKPAGPLTVSVVRDGTTLGSGVIAAGIEDQAARVRVGSGVGGARDVQVCVRNNGSRRVSVAGQEVPFGSGAHVTDPRQPQTRAMRIDWFEAGKATRLSRAGVIARRAGYAKASWVGTWTFWAVLALVLAASAAALALVLRETRRAVET